MKPSIMSPESEDVSAEPFSAKLCRLHPTFSLIVVRSHIMTLILFILTLMTATQERTDYRLQDFAENILQDYSLSNTIWNWVTRQANPIRVPRYQSLVVSGTLFELTAAKPDDRSKSSLTL